MSTQELHCHICRKDTTPYDMGDKNGYRLLACRACGSVLASPWPTDAAVDSYYGDIQPEIVHATDPEREIASAARILKKYLGMPRDGNARLLDANALRGYGVMAAQQLGYAATGINPLDFYDRFATEKYGQKNFEHAALPALAARGETFDAVLCISALTEQTDPDAFVAALARVLAPQGVVYIEEPDGNHLNTPRNFAEWDMVDPPVTCATLARPGIAALLARHGLVIRKRYFTWAPYMRLIVGHKAR